MFFDPNVSKESAKKPILAATIVLLHQSQSGEIKVFLAQRSEQSKFMPGAHVFPGGKVEDDDNILCDRVRIFHNQLLQTHLHPIEFFNFETINPNALIVAAIRESFEEIGLLFVVDENGHPVQKDFSQHRIKIRNKAISFADFLKTEQLFIDAGHLQYFSRWVTPFQEKKRFDAHFFLAHVSEEQFTQAKTDNEEMFFGSFLTLEDIFLMYEKQNLILMPPTLKTLDQLVQISQNKKIEDFFHQIWHQPHLPIQPFPVINKNLSLLLPNNACFPHEKSTEESQKYYCNALGKNSFLLLEDGKWLLKE